MAYIWKGNEKIVFSDYGGIAEIHNSAKVWVSYT